MLALNQIAQSGARIIDADGTVAGYASLFGVVDSTRDMIMPGAFARTLARRDVRRIPLLFQHDPAEPIGLWLVLEEDARGLRVRGRLIPDVQRAREVLALIRAGALDGLSIGFRTVRARVDPVTRVRRIFEVELWEVSIVTFPLLAGARVSVLKDRKYSPDQPRVPAGNSDGGRWIGGSGGGGSLAQTRRTQVARVIWICVAGSRMLTTDHLGNKSHWVIYECAGGQSFKRYGSGHRYRGFVADPFR